MKVTIANKTTKDKIDCTHELILTFLNDAILILDKNGEAIAELSTEPMLKENDYSTEDYFLIFKNLREKVPMMHNAVNVVTG